jgi:cyclase
MRVAENDMTLGSLSGRKKEVTSGEQRSYKSPPGSDVGIARKTERIGTILGPGLRCGWACERETIMRKFAFVLLALSFFLTLPAFAQQQPDWDKVQVKLQKLSGNLYMIQFVSANGGNAGANASVLVGDDGVVLVDAGFAPVAPKLDAALKTISDKPVKYLVNTHWHGDHTGGNAYFGKSAIIIAQDNARKRMETGDDLSRINRVNLLREIFPPFPAAALPVITFNDELTLHVDGEEIRAIHFPRGHTDTDSVIFFMQAKVAQTGTDFVNGNPGGFPAIDLDNDGTGGPQGEIAALGYIVDRMPDDVKVIPGHGGLASKVEVTRYLDVLKSTTAAVQGGIDQGKSLEQLKQEKVLAKWEYLNTRGVMKTDVYLERLYRSLSQKDGSANRSSR